MPYIIPNYRKLRLSISLSILLTHFISLKQKHVKYFEENVRGYVGVKVWLSLIIWVVLVIIGVLGVTMLGLGWDYHVIINMVVFFSWVGEYLY